MAVKFNPFTGQLQIDEKGASASYIDGEVATYNDLPLDGTAALNSAWLVREASGIWPVSRKQAGIYIRTATAGVSRDADYTYAGTMPDVFSDAVFTLYDEASTTRTGQFNLGNITAGQNRVLTWPDGNGTIARTEDFAAPPAIGSTTRNSGAFTTLSANNGTITVDSPALVVAQDSASATAFNLSEFRMTGAGTSNSNLIRGLSSGSQVFAVRRNGIIDATQLNWGNAWLLLGGNVSLPSGAYFGFTSSASGFSNQDTFLRRDAAGILAQHNLANPQAYRIYNTTDAGLTNFERGFLRWSSNVLQIGTEAGGTGSNRAVEFVQGGAARITVTSGGLIDLGAMTSIRFGNNLLINGGAIQLGNTGAGDAFQINRDGVGTMALRSGTQPHTLRIYNTVSGTGNVNFERANFRWASNEFIIDAESGGTGTSLRGIKIGSATSSLLGFYGVAPVDQPATVADPAGGGTVDTEARTAINAIIDRLQELGLIA